MNKSPHFFYLSPHFFRPFHILHVSYTSILPLDRAKTRRWCYGITHSSWRRARASETIANRDLRCFGQHSYASFSTVCLISARDQPRRRQELTCATAATPTIQLLLPISSRTIVIFADNKVFANDEGPFTNLWNSIKPYWII